MTERSFRYLFFCLAASTLFASCTYRFYPSGCDYPVGGSLVKQTLLDSSVRETSGLLYMDGSLWSFNDSGGEPVLYCLDAGNGSIIRKTIIRNATNVDWEDIAEDETHVYLADVGNNCGTRDTVIIYRIPRKAMLSGDSGINHDGIISLTFHGETGQTRSGLSSKDCEALLVYGDSLYLFTKDWVNETTAVYVIPKEPGHYNADPQTCYKAGMLVTGADLFRAGKQVSLLGYHDYMPVLISYRYDQSPAVISCGGKARIYPMRTGRQVEGICYDPQGRLFISAEKSLQKQTLFRVGRTMR
ncbi:MAG: hypothetical protein V2B15_03140 [Bacteroidota bacterium]